MVLFGLVTSIVSLKHRFSGMIEKRWKTLSEEDLVLRVYDAMRSKTSGESSVLYEPKGVALFVSFSQRHELSF